MSDHLIAYFDADRDAVIVARPSGTEVDVIDVEDAAALGEEILAASRRESTGYEEFLAQQNADAPAATATGDDATRGLCPGCRSPRRYAIGNNTFLPGTVCPACQSVAPAVEVEQGNYLIALTDEGDIALTDEHGNSVDVFRFSGALPTEAQDWDIYASALGLTRENVAVALEAAMAAEDAEWALNGACILTGENMGTEDDCTTHDHEPTAG